MQVFAVGEDVLYGSGPTARGAMRSVWRVMGVCSTVPMILSWVCGEGGVVGGVGTIVAPPLPPRGFTVGALVSLYPLLVFLPEYSWEYFRHFLYAVMLFFVLLTIFRWAVATPPLRCVAAALALPSVVFASGILLGIHGRIFASELCALFTPFIILFLVREAWGVPVVQMVGTVVLVAALLVESRVVVVGAAVACMVLHMVYTARSTEDDFWSMVLLYTVPALLCPFALWDGGGEVDAMGIATAAVWCEVAVQTRRRNLKPAGSGVSWATESTPMLVPISV